MLPLSEAAKQRVRMAFPAGSQPVVISLLERACGDNLSMGPRTPESADRIRIAALKVSGGDFRALEEAVKLAKMDWRDLLVAAGFECDVTAHERWWPRGALPGPDAAPAR